MTKSQGISKVVKIHPEGDKNVCSKFHGNPFSSREDNSLKATNVDLMVALEESQRITKVIRIHPLGTMDTCAKFHGNPSICCDIVWTKVVDQLTERHNQP